MPDDEYRLLHDVKDSGPGLSSALSISMARLARVVALGTPHVTQKGNGRRAVFESASDRAGLPGPPLPAQPPP